MTVDDARKMVQDAAIDMMYLGAVARGGPCDLGVMPRDPAGRLHSAMLAYEAAVRADERTAVGREAAGAIQGRQEA